MKGPLKWRKDLRLDFRGSWVADGEKGHYQILRIAEGSWILYLPGGEKITSNRLRSAKELASVHARYGLAL